ncbi:MAG: hypothetical protein NZ577_02310 [Vicinamibacterales bacterium]|nr:hypothetical protein [Vicinamibacterales bacterium]
MKRTDDQLKLDHSELRVDATASEWRMRVNDLQLNGAPGAPSAPVESIRRNLPA